MLKFVAIFATLTALGIGIVNAEQEEANLPNQNGPFLTKMAVPGADFDIIFVTTKSRACSNVDCGNAYEARVDQWTTRVDLVPKVDALPSPER